MTYMGYPVDRMSPKIMDVARRNLQNTYDNLAAGLTVNTKDPVLLKAIVQASADAEQYLTKPVAKVVQKQITAIQERFAEQGGQMNGTLFKNMHDALEKVADPTATPIIEDLQQAMRGAMTRSSSKADAALLAKTDQQYGAMKALEKSFGPSERIDPNKFYAATDTTQGAAASVYGRGPNAPLAQLASAAKLIINDLPAQQAGGLTAKSLTDYAEKRIAFHATMMGAGGYEGYKKGGVKGGIAGVAFALGGMSLLRSIGSNPAAANQLAQFANSKGLRTVQSAAAWAARRGGAATGAMVSNQFTGGSDEQGQAPQ
jgi:hypothetical protein